MKSSRLFTRTAGVGVLIAVAVTLSACSSSGGTGNSATGGGKTTGPGSGASSQAGASSQSSVAPGEPAVPSGTGDATLPQGQPGKGKPAVTMGDKNFAEEYLLGQLYSQALQAKGFTVNLKENIGASAVIDKAMTSGQIDGYPEYTGVIYTELAKLGDKPKSAQVTLEGATKFENTRGYGVLNPTAFQDKDGVAALNDFAQKHALKQIGDLKKLSSFTYAGPPENGTRYQGVVGLKQAYGLTNLTFKPLTIPLQYAALDRKQVDTIAIFTTDGQLASNKYTVLDDTQGIFGFQQVVPVFKQSVLDAEGPAFAATLNAVSALLSTKAIIALNKAVQIDQKSPKSVAQAFLKANNIT